MKNILFLLLIFCFTVTNIQGQVIHLSTVCDTGDNRQGNGIGASVAVDKKKVEKTFEDYFKDCLQITSLPEGPFTKQDVFKAIENLKVAENDTVMLYYSGHGGYDYTKGIQFFTLYGREKEQGMISRTELMDRLLAKKARLTICLSDCCNTLLSTEEQLYPQEPEEELLIKIPERGLESLFFNARGVVDITSSKIGEVSLCIRSGNSNNIGGLFTKIFLYFLSKNRYNEKITWQDIQSEMQPKMTGAFQKILTRLDRKYLDVSKASIPVIPGLSTRQTNQRIHIYRCPQMPARLGLSVKNHSEAGVSVIKVISNTPAEKAGICPGDVLLEINHTKIDNKVAFGILVDYSPRNMQLKVRTAAGEEKDVQVCLAWE